MGKRRCIVTVVLTAAFWVTVTPPADAGSVARIRVSFAVDNVNRSALPCSQPDGKPYMIVGEVVGPPSLLARGSELTATLYLHEFSFGMFFWRFDAVPGYNYASALAREGHISVIVDRLGYDESGHPAGGSSCLGAQADMAAQIVRQLKNGSYTVESGAAIAFERIVLAGHSVGGGTAELAAHSFADLGIAGLVLFAWADQGYSARSVEQATQQAIDCAPGGEPAEPGGPTGYAYFGRTRSDFQQNVFADTDPSVREAATAMRNRDPCGDNATLLRMAAVNAASVRNIRVPVLLLFGGDDAMFEDNSDEVQAALFLNSPSVTPRSFPRAGHALTLERSAPEVHSAAATWLEDKGLVSAPQPTSKSPRDAGSKPPADRPASVLAEQVERGDALPLTGVLWHPVVGAVLVGFAFALGWRTMQPQTQELAPWRRRRSARWA